MVTCLTDADTGPQTTRRLDGANATWVTTRESMFQGDSAAGMVILDPLAAVGLIAPTNLSEFHNASQVPAEPP